MKQNRQKLSGIQWRVLKVQWNIVSVITVTYFVGVMLATSIIQSVPSFNHWFEQTTNLVIYSNSFFIIVITNMIFVFITTFIVSFIYSLPLARYLKNRVQLLIDSATSFSRGKLTERINFQDKNEFSILSERFNAMASHYEKQVGSLQKLLNENSLLLNQAQQAASLEERRKLARDLHDAVSQQLFAISMTMAALPKLMENNQEQAKLGFSHVEKMVLNAQQELRALIMHLRPVELEGKSFREGLQSLINELKVKNNHLTIQCELNHKAQLQPGVEDQLFRVIQEAISNMLRHSKATSFFIKSYEKDERIFLVLEDNGIGFHVNQSDHNGYGLETMQERMIELGGVLKILSYPNKGTKLEMVVPLK